MQSNVEKTNYWNRKVEYQSKNTAQKVLGITQNPNQKKANAAGCGCGGCGVECGGGGCS